MKSDILVKGLTFIAGSAIGSVITWKLVKTKYEKRADEEIHSIREYYEEQLKKESDISEPVNETKEEDSELSLDRIRERVNEREKIKEEETEDVLGPQIVAPEELWERDYPTISLTYYEGDGVLADECDKEISNVSDLVPEDFADHFGEYEDDSVFVRNDNIKVYYEILRDLGSFSEID